MRKGRNLRPNITSSEQAQKMGKKGGQNRSLRKKLSQRKNCNEECPLWINCWAKPISLSKQKQNKSKHAKCVLKNMPIKIIERAERILLYGEEGFNMEIINTLLRFANQMDITDTPANIRDYLDELRKTKESIYGKKQRVEAKVEENLHNGSKILTAADFNRAYQEVLDEEAEKEKKLPSNRKQPPSEG